MKIKEVMEACGLTEKAIRLYVAKGLVQPEVTEQNGRSFRNYTEDNVRTLKQIGTLRRASFSLEQIGEMLEHPERVEEIFCRYREELNEQAGQLAEIAGLVNGVEADALTDMAALARCLTPGAEKAPPVWRWRVWDEDVNEEERARCYREFLLHQEKRDRRERIFGPLAELWFAHWRAFLISFAAGALTMFCLFNLTIFRPVNLTLDGVLFTTGGSFVTYPVSITLRGERRYTLLGSRTMSCTFSSVDFSLRRWAGTELAEVEEPVSFTFDLREDGSALSEGDAMLFWNGRLGDAELRVERVWFGDFSQILFRMKNISERSDRVYYAAFPASNRDEALGVYYAYRDTLPETSDEK